MKRREGEEVSLIQQYKIGHFSQKKNRWLMKKLKKFGQNKCWPQKKLHRIPGYVKGRSVSTKQVLATEKLQVELDLEKEKSKLEEEIRVIKEEQLQFQEEQIKYKEEQKERTEFMMRELSRLSRLQFKKKKN